jgi:hypothetical protein
LQNSQNLFYAESFEKLGFYIYGDIFPSLTDKEKQERDLETYVIPYLPYFSQCEKFGDYLILDNIFNDPSCEFVPEDEVSVIGDFDFGRSPNAQTCHDLSYSYVMRRSETQETILSSETTGLHDKWVTFFTSI